MLMARAIYFVIIIVIVDFGRDIRVPNLSVSVYFHAPSVRVYSNSSRAQPLHRDRGQAGTLVPTLYSLTFW